MNINLTGADIYNKRASFQSVVEKSDLNSRRNSKITNLDTYFDKYNDKKRSLINQETSEYVPYKDKDLHIHYHSDLKLPHIHSSSCERVVSAHDTNREKRYYFTNKLTPVRVYINYSSNHKEHDNDKKALVTINSANNQNATSKISVSEKFFKEISNMKFVKETLSFIPNSASKNQNSSNE